MSDNSPLKGWTPLPESLQKLPRMGFTRRKAETSAELEMDDVVFGVTSIADAIRKGEALRAKKAAEAAKKA